MNIELLRDYCLSKKGSSESLPFDETTLVFKVMNKMFALTSLTGNLSVSLKCDPELAITLREEYSYVVSAFHMHKRHWNTIYINDSVSDNFVYKWIDHSYELVVKGLTKKMQQELKSLENE